MADKQKMMQDLKNKRREEEVVAEDLMLKQLEKDKGKLESTPNPESGVASASSSGANLSGSQVGNSDAEVAKAKPGDWIVRKDGTKYQLNQGDIEAASKKVGGSSPVAEETTIPEPTQDNAPSSASEEAGGEKASEGVNGANVSPSSEGAAVTDSKPNYTEAMQGREPSRVEVAGPTPGTYRGVAVGPGTDHSYEDPKLSGENRSSDSTVSRGTVEAVEELSNDPVRQSAVEKAIGLPEGQSMSFWQNLALFVEAFGAGYTGKQSQIVQAAIAEMKAEKDSQRKIAEEEESARIEVEKESKNRATKIADYKKSHPGASDNEAYEATQDMSNVRLGKEQSANKKSELEHETETKFKDDDRRYEWSVDGYLDSMGVTRETASQEQLMRATTLANENAFKASESAEERKLKMDLQREANAHAESILKLKDELEKDKAFEDLGIDPKELKGLSEDKKLSFIAHRYQALRQGKDQGQVKFDNTITGINAGANAVNTATGIFK